MIKEGKIYNVEKGKIRFLGDKLEVSNSVLRSEVEEFLKSIGENPHYWVTRKGKYDKELNGFYHCYIKSNIYTNELDVLFDKMSEKLEKKGIRYFVSVFSEKKHYIQADVYDIESEIEDVLKTTARIFKWNSKSEEIRFRYELKNWWNKEYYIFINWKGKEFVWETFYYEKEKYRVRLVMPLKMNKHLRKI